MNDTLKQLHWLAQFSTSFGLRHVPRHPLWHHVALRIQDGTWRSAATPDGTALLLRPAAGWVGIASGSSERVLALDGHTLADVRAWLEQELEATGLTGGLTLRDPGGLPDHPVRDGAAIRLDPGEARAAAALYDQAQRVLSAWAARRRDAGPVLLFPHHFDASVLRTVEVGARAGGEDARTVSAGLSPGDAGSEHPYWYVTPWPYPKDPELPDPPPGAYWHTQGWTGAVLAAPQPRPDAEASAFLAWADAAAERLTDCTPRPDCPRRVEAPA